jgi:dipeptidyl aminopeptidase/acylaminoacyl peptidase
MDLASPSMTGRTVFALIALAGAVAVLSGCGGSAASGLRWTDETPSWSPDGREIVFASNRADPRSAIDRLYVMNADGRHVKLLTPESVFALDAREPSFSPDASKIVYAANVLNASNQFTGAGAIWVMSADGTNPRSLTPGLRSASDEPAWSPNGRLIAFLSGGSDLYVVRPDGSGLRRLARNIDGWAFAWSPNSKTIAVSDDEHLHLIPVVATKAIDVGAAISFPTYQTTDIAWSPRGADIAFVRGKQVYDGSGDIAPRYLWIRDVRSGHERRLAEVTDSESNGGFEVTITWVPRRTPTLAVFDSDYRIHLITAAGHTGRSFATSGGRLATGSASPNGDKLLVVDGHPGSYLSALSVASINGNLYKRLTQLNH